MNSKHSSIEEVVKPSYERLSCQTVEVETQGVLCASNGGGLTGGLTGGLDFYGGSAL